LQALETPISLLDDQSSMQAALPNCKIRYGAAASEDDFEADADDDRPENE
jgi:hypothetical protein